MPTTVQCLCPQFRLSWRPTPANPLAMLFPTMTSDDPMRKRRPETSFTWGLKGMEFSWTPRTTTLEWLDAFPVPFLGRAISTTASLARSLRPSGPIAAWGSISTIEACPRSMPLITSDVEPLRQTTTLSGEPVSTSVFWRPSAIIRTAAKTNTTSAIPETVRLVVNRRFQRFRML